MSKSSFQLSLFISQNKRRGNWIVFLKNFIDFHKYHLMIHHQMMILYLIDNLSKTFKNLVLKKSPP